MDTAESKGYGIRCGNSKYQWLWTCLCYTKQQANNKILRNFLSNPDGYIKNKGRNRDAILAKLKRKYRLKVVKVKMIEEH